MSFYIDGELKGTFFRIAPGKPKVYDYNVPVFTIESLTPEEHNFTLQIGHVNGIQSLILFDKMIYTCVISDRPATCTKAILQSFRSHLAFFLSFALFFLSFRCTEFGTKQLRGIIDSNQKESLE